MARLPTVGGDTGNWGEILNAFLRIEHNEDGTLKANGSLLNKYTKPPTGIPESDLSSAVQSKLNAPTVVPAEYFRFAHNTLDDIQSGTSNVQFTTTHATKLAGIQSGAQVNAVTTVASKTGDVTLDKTDVGLDAVDNTSDANKPISAATQVALDLKLDKQTSSVPLSVYTVDNAGVQGVRQASSTNSASGSVVLRGSNGSILGVTPLNPSDLTRKDYVDAQIALKGDVTGPSGATDTALARFDGTTGGLLKNSLITVSDAGTMTAPYIRTTSYSLNNGLNAFGDITSANNFLTVNQAGATGVQIASQFVGQGTVSTAAARSSTLNARFSANANAPSFILAKSRSNSILSNAVVQQNDVLGNIGFDGDDGATIIEAARIRAVVDGTAGTNSMPGRLEFMTTASGANVASTVMTLSSDNKMGLLTTAPTHTVTIGSTGNGVAIYNTADQTNNYERGRVSFESNVLSIATETGGTGTARAIRLRTGSGRTLTVNDTPGTNGFIAMDAATSAANANGLVIGGNTWSAVSGINNFALINPTVGQSGTAGYTALKINPTENSVGSGPRLLIDAQVNGSSKFTVDVNGAVTGASPTSDLHLATKQYVDTRALGSRNLITNGSFEDGVSPFGAVNGASIASVTTQVRTGSRSIQVTFGSVVGDSGIRLVGTSTVLVANRVYVASAWVWVPSTNTPGSVRLSVQGTGLIPAPGSSSSSIQSSWVTGYGDQWMQLQVTFQMPTTTTPVNIYVIATNTTAGQLLYVDDVALQYAQESSTFSEAGQIWTASIANKLAFVDGANIDAGSATGTMIGTGSTQKLGFFGATPVARQGSTVDLGVLLSNLGLRTSGTAYPLTTSGNVVFSGSTRLGSSNDTAATVTMTTSSSPFRFANAATNAISYTLPTTTSAGMIYTIKKIDASTNAVTIQGTIDGQTNYVLTSQWKYVSLVSTTTSGVWHIVGNN
jgi:Cu/Ag efflux protein CusF